MKNIKLFGLLFAGLILLLHNKTDAQHVHHHTHTEEPGQVANSIPSPAGIMGDHIHGKGSWMFSYMYMGMQMDGLYSGRSEVKPMQLMDQYEGVPENMFMQMHMLGAMYAFNDRFTLMAMVPLLQQEMDHVHIAHHHSGNEMNSSGLGDIQVSVIFPVFNRNNHKMILNGGLSLPTGSINVSSEAMGMDSRMGYGMQLGSGTPDLHGTFSYSVQFDTWKTGSQLGGVVRLGNNREKYRFGNSVEHSLWAAKKFPVPLSATVRLNSVWQDHIHGSDSNIHPDMMPAANPECYGGFHSKVMGGLNLELGSFLPVHASLGFEAGLPVYQYLNGPQMRETWSLVSTLRISI